jgi:hypothetical protein
MEKNEDLATTVWSIVGTALFASWFLVLGPLGALLLLGVAYAMHVESLTLGIVCGVILFLPVVLTVVWAPLCVAGVSQEQQVEGKATLAATESIL